MKAAAWTWPKEREKKIKLKRYFKPDYQISRSSLFVDVLNVTFLFSSDLVEPVPRLLAGLVPRRGDDPVLEDVHGHGDDRVQQQRRRPDAALF